MEHRIKPRNKKLFFTILQSIVIFLSWFPIAETLPKTVSPLSSLDKLSFQLKGDIGPFVDFTRLYACACVAKKNPDKIWDLPCVIDALKSALAMNPADNSLINQVQTPVLFTPQYIVLAMPLTVLPLNWAVIVFEIITLIVAIISIAALLRKYHKFSQLETFLFWAVVLGSPMFFQNFYLAQCEVFLAGLSAIFLLNWQKETSFGAALALALTISIKPHHSFIMLVMAASARRYKLLLLTVLFVALILFVTALTIGPSAILKYPSILWMAQSGFDQGTLHLPVHNMINLVGMISWLSYRYHSIGYLFNLFSALLGLSITILIWRKAVASGPNCYPFAYAISLLLNLILGLYENFYALFLLSAAWAITIPETSLNRFSEIKNRSLYLWTIAFLLLPIISWFICDKFPSCQGQLHLGILILLLVIAFCNFWNILSDKLKISGNKYLNSSGS